MITDEEMTARSLECTDDAIDRFKDFCYLKNTKENDLLTFMAFIFAELGSMQAEQEFLFQAVNKLLEEKITIN